MPNRALKKARFSGSRTLAPGLSAGNHEGRGGSKAHVLRHQTGGPAAVRLQVGQRKIDALRKIGKRHPAGNVGRIRSRHGVGRCIFEKTVTRSASHRDCRTTSGWRGRWRRERRSQCQRRSDRRGVLSLRRVSDPFGRIRRHTTCPPSRPEGFDRAQRLPAISRLAS